MVTLLERKLLGLRQIRFGPNKTRIFGVIQPILDGLKLIKKTRVWNFKINILFFNMTCYFILLVRIYLWLSFPFKAWVSNKSILVFWVLFLIGVSRFFVLILGWRSFRKYSLLGRIRRVRQVISLEVLIIILFLCYFIALNSLSLLNIKFSIIFIALGVLILRVIILETHRAPFDLSEGERELVRGYNIEFRRILFILIFLSEYNTLVFFSLFWSFIFRKMFWSFFILFILLIIRTCFPRVRYDYIINYTWVVLLPASVFLSLLVIVFKHC